jgi:hypothetical protein
MIKRIGESKSFWLLGALTIASYFPSPGVPSVFDDAKNVMGDPAIIVFSRSFLAESRLALTDNSRLCNELAGGSGGVIA